MMSQAIRSLKEKISNLEWVLEQMERVESDADDLLEDYANDLATPKNDETYEITLLKLEERAKYLYDDFSYEMNNKHDYFDDSEYSDYEYEFKQDLKEKWEEVIDLAKDKLDYNVWHEKKLSEFKDIYPDLVDIKDIGGNEDDFILTHVGGSKTLYMSIESKYIPLHMLDLITILDREDEDRTVGLYGSYFHVEWLNSDYNNSQGMEMLHLIITENYILSTRSGY